MFSAYSFRPRVWALALATAFCAAGVALGNWQAGRGEEKRAVGARLDEATRAAALELPARPVAAADYALKRVAARGAFEPQYTILLDNKLRHGRVGYEVLTPLALGNGMHVLVKRGWVAAPPTRDRLPEVRTPLGAVRVEGLAFEHLPRLLEAGNALGPVRQSLHIDAFAKDTGLALQPFFLEQHSSAEDGLLREWTPPDTGAAKHDMYALQWYSLAVLAVVLAVVLSFRRHETVSQ